MHLLWYYLGLTNPSGWPYLLWSGIVGDVLIPGALIAWLRHHNCYERGCWRPGHPHEGKVACRKHFGEVHGA